MTVASIHLWGTRIGAVRWDAGDGCADFEYDPSFAGSAIEVCPLTMPLGSPSIWRFPALPKDTFRGLPGLLSDALPDRFGNALIDRWLAREGRTAADFDPVQRLCYVGTRGMGALTFEPAIERGKGEASPIDLDELVGIASRVLGERESFRSSLEGDPLDGLADILRVGTSAGGARPKAVIAWNPKTDEVRSGQVAAPPGFEHWLLKFDGVEGAIGYDEVLGRSGGYGAIEYAYANMAIAAGIEMEPSRLLEENGRRHFMTRRFDRTADGDRVHALSLGGMAHFDFNHAGGHGYEQAFRVMERLRLPKAQVEEQFRRMAFNVVARNQDDHVKNIAFLMDRRGQWRLSPAYDVTFAYNPNGEWTASHQMTVDGQRDGITREHIRAVGKGISLRRGAADEILDGVLAAVEEWPRFATEAGVADDRIGAIQACHRRGI